MYEINDPTVDGATDGGHGLMGHLKRVLKRTVLMQYFVRLYLRVDFVWDCERRPIIVSFSAPIEGQLCKIVLPLFMDGSPNLEP